MFEEDTRARMAHQQRDDQLAAFKAAMAKPLAVTSKDIMSKGGFVPAMEEAATLRKAQELVSTVVKAGGGAKLMRDLRHRAGEVVPFKKAAPPAKPSRPVQQPQPLRPAARTQKLDEPLRKLVVAGHPQPTRDTFNKLDKVPGLGDQLKTAVRC